jgi:predicted O-linked N-acetylglucosamine transferase (SPINDLY family)
MHRRLEFFIFFFTLTWAIDYHHQRRELYYDSFLKRSNQVSALKSSIKEDYIARANRLFEAGLVAHKEKREADALRKYHQALTLVPENATIWFSLGVSLHHSGAIFDAASAYTHALYIDDMHISSLVNLAALHQVFGNPKSAIEVYLQLMNVASRGPIGWDLLLTAKINLGVAYTQTGKFTQGKIHYDDSLKLLETLSTQYCKSKSSDTVGGDITSDCANVRVTEVYLRNHLMNLKRPTCIWQGMEETMVLLSRAKRYAEGNIPALLPFDSLLAPLSNAARLAIARAQSDNEELRIEKIVPQLHPQDIYINTARGGALRIGFLGYDFNDHPTSHLIESIFETIHQGRGSENGTSRSLFKSIHLTLYSYGKDDGSYYRERLFALADDVLQLEAMNYSQAAVAVRKHGPHILLDTQLHTYGNRLLIAAARPSPLQINYLVYPGTSGARFLDHIVVDAIIAPPEHALFYSEKLLVLPPSYQPSYFDRHIASASHYVSTYREKRNWPDISPIESKRNCNLFHRELGTIRAHYGLPKDDNIVLFVNFNKADKLDLETTQLWLRTMNRVPRSHLWLLRPSLPNLPDSNSNEESNYSSDSEQDSKVESNLRAMAAAFGISPRRLHFAPRTEKWKHVLRHAAGDLFIDSIVYGAHSTATDSLRGGLPVLTMLGPSFASRVAASLYASFDVEANSMPNWTFNSSRNSASAGIGCRNSMLVASSLREMEDRSVRLSYSQRQRDALKVKLEKDISSQKGIFNTERSVVTTLRSMQLVVDANRADYSNSKLTDRWHTVLVT